MRRFLIAMIIGPERARRIPWVRGDTAGFRVFSRRPVRPGSQWSSGAKGGWGGGFRGTQSKPGQTTCFYGQWRSQPGLRQAVVGGLLILLSIFISGCEGPNSGARFPSQKEPTPSASTAIQPTNPMPAP